MRSADVFAYLFFVVVVVVPTSTIYLFVSELQVCFNLTFGHNAAFTGRLPVKATFTFFVFVFSRETRNPANHTLTSRTNRGTYLDWSRSTALFHSLESDATSNTTFLCPSQRHHGGFPAQGGHSDHTGAHRTRQEGNAPTCDNAKGRMPRRQPKSQTKPSRQPLYT